MWEEANKIATFIHSQILSPPQVGIILGTGLGRLVQEIELTNELLYDKIPGFPVTSVEGHLGKLILGRLGGKQVIAMQGRIHYYEGIPMQKVVLPVRVMRLLGIRLLILSNASGGLNPSFEIGDMMFATDQMNLMQNNPLVGFHDPRLGPRFPDMSDVFDKEILKLATILANQHHIPFHLGVLAAVSGPLFETKAEYAYIRSLGADAVGMSIIPETIAARQMNLPCFAISVISDLGVTGKIIEVTHDEVQKAAKQTEPLMTKLIKKLLEAL